MISFTTTAMPRPDILDKCYESFSKNLFGVDMKRSVLYLNIDPFPYDNAKQFVQINRLRENVLSVAKKYFKTVYYNTPDKPNYAAAYKWLWGSAKSDVIINIEDDWELIRPVNIDILLNKYSHVKYEIVFRAYGYNYPCCCTSPAILKKRFYSEIARGMNTQENPECQIHRNGDGRYSIIIPNSRTKDIKTYVVAYPEYRNVHRNIIVKDIGREWFKRCPYIIPQHNSIIRYQQYVTDKKKARAEGKIYTKKRPKIRTKVDFVKWELDESINPLNWLIEYK